VAFQEALNDTEEWASTRTSAFSLSTSMKSDTSTDSGIIVGDANSKTGSQDQAVSALGLETDDDAAIARALQDDKMSPDPSPKYLSKEGSSNEGDSSEVQGKGLLGRFKLLGSKIFPGSVPTWSTSGGQTTYKQSRWSQDSKLESETMCIWSGAGEVVPFISSSSHTTLLPYESVEYHFHQGVSALSASRSKGGKVRKYDS
jgi:hypothetical protein